MAAKLNWVDRAIAAVAPVAAVRRMQARQALAIGDSYYASSPERRAVRNWRPFARSADADTVPVLADLRAKSRDLVRNNALAGGAVATVVTAVVGTGLSVQPQLLARRLRMSEEAAQAWQQEAKELFELWASRPEWCDQAARLNFYGLQEVAFRSALESGDLFALLPMERFGGAPFETRVQLIEADRVTNPRSQFSNIGPDGWVGGIRTDDGGRPVAAWVADQHPGGLIFNTTTLTGREVAFYGKSGRRNLLHLVPIERPGQRRGVPYLAPVMEPLRQLGVYTDAEIMAAVVSGMFTVFVTRPNAENPPDLAGTSTATVAPGERDGDDVGLGNGAIVDLVEGESVSTANPGRPNEKFDPFVQAILRQIGVRLELPFEVLIKHFTASYSAARAALLEAWRFYRKRREWLAAQFCQPVYEAVITEAILTGRLPAPGFLRDPILRASYLRAVWIGDAPGAIDPLRETEAAGRRIAIGISDKAAETIAYSGRNWEDVHAQQVREKRAAERDGMVPMQTSAPPMADNDEDNDEDTE